MIAHQDFHPKSLLVTGGAGFIGANFVHHWLSDGNETQVTVLDALTYAGNYANLADLQDDPRFRFVHGDIRDEESVEAIMAKERVDTIVHFAAESHVDRSIHGPEEFLQTNVLGTHTLLKVARRVWLDEGSGRDHRFQHVSTDEVYGSLAPDDPAFKETNPYAPNSPYAASKASSDHLVRAYRHTYGLQTVTSNCSNNYGPYQFPEKLIPLMLVNIIHGETLPVYGDGLNVRDWLYVRDHCIGIDLCLRKGGIGETYNLGGNNEWTNIDIVHLLCDLVDQRFDSNPELAAAYPDAPPANGERSESLVRFVEDRPGHDRRYAMDISKAELQLGYRPKETFETGITKTVQWYLDHPDWWSAIMDGRYRDWIKTNY